MSGARSNTAGSGVVGRSVPRVDAVDKVTGRAVYASDVAVPGMLEARILRSSVAHARIVRIDAARAEALPGVVAVLTAADVRDIDPYYGVAFKDQPLVAIDRVRYQGEPVAAVAAVDADTAEAALELIAVEYDDLPVVATIDDALAAGSPRLHGDLRQNAFPHPRSLQPLPGTNVCHSYRLRRGDAAAAFASADVVLDNVYTLPPVQHAALESFVAIASWTRDRLEIWASAQHPFHVRRELAEMFGLPHHAVRVHAPLIGGAFGQKSYTKLEPLAAALARKAGRPVRVALTMAEAFLTLTRHGARLRVKTGARRDGTLVARKVELWLDTGAYADVGPNVTRKAGYWSIGLYRWANLEVDAYCVFTNKVPAGAFRGYGGPQAGWAGELQIAELAAALGLDPVELRRRNLLGRGERYDPADTPLDGDIISHLDRVERVLAASGPVRAGRGRGIVVGFKNGGGRNTVSNSIVRLQADGSVTVGAGSVEMGQGTRTVMAQIAAEALSLPLERVRVPGPDTDVTPYDHGTSASRSTTLMGYAVWQAALDVRRQLAAVAAEVFEAPPDLVRLADGVASAGPRSMTYADLLVRHFGMPGGELIGTGVYRLGTFTGSLGASATFWEMGVGGAEVDVDAETGEVRLARYITTADVGRAINPALCEGQDEGAAMQGIGHALREALVFDQGQLLNAGLIDYPVPTMEALPEEFVSILVEDGGGPGPYGAKGVGEAGVIAPAPAIAAAVYAATGVWVRDLPLTPERVWRAKRGTPAKRRGGRSLVESPSVYERWATRRGQTRGLIRFGAQHPTHPWWTIADIVCEALVGYHRALLPDVRVGVFTSTDLQGALWNPVDVGAGELTLGMTTPSAAARMAVGGTGAYRTAHPGLRAIAVYPHLDFVIFMISARTGITSLEELVKNRYPLKLVTGRRTQGQPDILTFTVEEVLRQYGASYDAIERWGGRVLFGGPTHIGGTLVLEGHAEAIFQEHKHASVWHQIAESQPMHCLAVDESVLRHMQQAYGYAAAEIPAGAYRGVDHPVRTVDFSGWLVVCREDMPAEWAYAVARACDVTREQVNRALRDRTLLTWAPLAMPSAADGMFSHTAIPLHPGAAAYARERGYLVPG